MTKSEITVSMSFIRDKESLQHQFIFNEDDHGLPYMLEKLEQFLTNMGFVLDGTQLDLVKTDTYMFDKDETIDYNVSDNVTKFPGKD